MIYKTLAIASAVVAATPSVAQSSEDRPADGSTDVVVTASAYRGDVSSGGARIDADIKDLPLSISVATRALIDDRQIRNLRDLSENVAGVRSRQSGGGAFAVDFTVRGLQGGSVAVNGYRVDNFAAGFDPQAVERVEFLKGPASVLYGASGALSGLVNIVTKTPTADNFLTVDLTGGAPLYGRVGVDGNVRLTDDLDARTNIALTHDKRVDAFRDVDAQFVSQSLRWRPATNLSFLVDGSYFRSTGPSRSATTRPGDMRFDELSRRFKFGERYDRGETHGYTLRTEANWEIAQGLTLHQGFNIQRFKQDEIDVRPNELIAPDVISRYAYTDRSTNVYKVSQSEIRWNFTLGPTRHKLLAGYEYSDFDGDGTCCDVVDIPDLDLLDPVYGSPRPALTYNELNHNQTGANAFYAQDFIEIGQFRVLAGVRRDSTTQSSQFCNLTDPLCAAGDPVARNLSDAKEKAFSPRLGVAWQPSDRTTLYVSYSKSFNPVPALDRNGKLLPAERGIQYEGGVRQELLDPGKLLLTLSAFTLTRRNIPDCDPISPDCSRQASIGAQRIRGIEAELTGKPVDWIDVIAAYTYLDGKVTKNDPAINGIAVGSKLPETTPHSGSVFTKIGLDPIGAKDVAISAGLYYVSSRPGRNYFFGQSGGPFDRAFLRLPASTRLDFGAYWDMSEAVRLQANLTNVFGVRVYEPANYGFNLIENRRFTLGASLRF